VASRARIAASSLRQSMFGMRKMDLAPWARGGLVRRTRAFAGIGVVGLIDLHDSHSFGG